MMLALHGGVKEVDIRTHAARSARQSSALGTELPSKCGGMCPIKSGRIYPDLADFPIVAASPPVGRDRLVVARSQRGS